MRYVFDTNIILHIVRNSIVWQRIKTDFNFSNKNIFISIVTYAEIKSLAKQLNWGKEKTKFLEKILNKFPILYINKNIVEYYVEIDVYSQGKIKKKIFQIISLQEIWEKTICGLLQQQNILKQN